MKKIALLSICTAAFLPAALAGCSDKKSSSAEVEDKPVERVSPKRIAFEWQEPYKAKIDEFRSSADFSQEDSRFDIRDLDRNGTPELIISPASDPNSACQLYTFSGGEVISLGENGSFGCFVYYPENCCFNSEHYGQGFILGEYRTLSENGFKTELSYYNNADSASSGAAITYEIDKEEVTLKQYDEEISKFAGYPSVLLGRKYTFGNACEEQALYFTESWRAVLSEKEKELIRNKLTELAPDYDGYAGFELCDLDNDDCPELIFSEGISDGCGCRIFCLNEGELTELEGKYGNSGKIGFDAEKYVFFSVDSSGNQCWNLTDEPLDNYEKSDSIIECGRNYLLSDAVINYALQ